MKKVKRTRRAKPRVAKADGRVGIWITVIAILLGVAVYAANRLPGSEAATGPKIKFLTPTHTEDLDMNSKYLVKFSNTMTVPGGKPLSVEFYVRDYENDRNFAMIKRMTIPAGQAAGSFSWHVGYDLNDRRIKWLPKNHLFMTASIVGGNASSGYEFHVVPADDGTGLPIIYLIDPNRGQSEGGSKVVIHGRNLIGKKGVTEVYFADKRAIVSIGSTNNGRRMTVVTPSRDTEPMTVDVTVKTDRGSYVAKEAFEYFWRV